MNLNDDADDADSDDVNLVDRTAPAVVSAPDLVTGVGLKDTAVGRQPTVVSLLHAQQPEDEDEDDVATWTRSSAGSDLVHSSTSTTFSLLNLLSFSLFSSLLPLSFIGSLASALTTTETTE